MAEDEMTAATAACLRLAALLAEDAVDAAIEAGLMQFQADAACRHDAADALRSVQQAQQKLRSAWAARERYRARSARLALRAEAREARRRAAAVPVADAPMPTVAVAPALPPAVAAALARAKARAAGTGS